MAERRNGFIDNRARELNPIAQGVLKGMKEGETYTAVDLIQMAGDRYARPSAQQRFGYEVISPLKEDLRIACAGTKPTVYRSLSDKEREEAGKALRAKTKTY